jgi:hypothetical protein
MSSFTFAWHYVRDEHDDVHVYRESGRNTMCGKDKRWTTSMVPLGDHNDHFVSCENCRDALRIVMLDFVDRVTGLHQRLSALEAEERNKAGRVRAAV